MRAKKRGLHVVDKIFLYINFALCFALLLSYLAAFVDPAKFWLFAFFGLGFPFLLFANIVMIAYWAIRKSWWIFLPLICILIGWNVLLNNIGIRLPSSKSYSTNVNVITLMTYNVHNFKPYGYKNDLGTKHEFLKVIKNEQPTVIAMQEFYTRKRGQYDMIDSCKAILRTGHYYYVPFNSAADESAGMATFSKYPIVASGLIQLAPLVSDNQCLYTDIKKGKSIFRVYNIHLQSIGFEPLDYEYLGSFMKHGKVSKMGTSRVFAKLKDAFKRRSEQVKIIKAHAAKCPYPYIFLGDFNDTPASYSVTQMAKGMKNTFREKGGGMSRTYNGDFPNYQIDFIMVSPQIEVGSYNVIEKKLSDHYPVVTELLLKQ